MIILKTKADLQYFISCELELLVSFWINGENIMLTTPINPNLNLFGELYKYSIKLLNGIKLFKGNIFCPCWMYINNHMGLL